jgi:hypothetical protein
MKLTTDVLEEYLFCPRNLYFREIKGISLYNHPYRKRIFTLRNEINHLTSQFFSRYYLPDERNCSIPIRRIISTERHSSFECSFVHRESDYRENLDLEEKVFTFLDSVLNDVSSSKGKNSSSFPNNFILNPLLFSKPLNLFANPSIIIINTDNTITWILQTFSMPYGLDDYYFFSKFHILLALSLKMLLRNIITVDYRNMSINTQIFDDKKMSSFESQITSLKNALESNNFGMNSHNCKYCEFELICINYQE